MSIHSFLRPLQDTITQIDMKITVSESHFEYTAHWDVDEHGDGRPSVDDAVDAALYLLSRVFDGQKVEDCAHDWEI